MVLYRKYHEATDFPTLERWWAGHKAVPAPREMLRTDGWIAHASGVDLAASFLYVTNVKIAFIELTTTNPQVAFCREKVEAVKGLYQRLEIAAREMGCGAVISFVDPESWERRTMEKMGYKTSTDAKPHLMLAKPLLPTEAVA